MRDDSIDILMKVPDFACTATKCQSLNLVFCLWSTTQSLLQGQFVEKQGQVSGVWGQFFRSSNDLADR